MGYKVSVNHPHFPDGTEFSIGALGVIPNGSSKDVDEDEERAFLNMRGLPLHEAFVGDATINVTGSHTLSTTEIDEVKAFFAAGVEEPVASEVTGASGTSVFAPATPEETPAPASEEEAVSDDA